MLVEMTDKEIEKLGADRWIAPRRKYALIYLITAVIVVACFKYILVDFYSIESVILNIVITVGMSVLWIVPLYRFVKRMSNAGKQLLMVGAKEKVGY